MSSKAKKPFYKKIWFWIIALIIIGGAFGAGGSKDKDSAATSSSNKEKTKVVEKEKQDTRKITYDKFSQIKMGSTYDDAKKILGEGKESTSSDVGGIKTAIYSWDNEDASNMNITVQNNKILGKAQIGLSLKKADTNMEKYNKIKTGMDYNQVKEILGDGELMSISKIAETDTCIYSWVNSAGSNMNVTFQSGKSTSKAQLGLK